MYGVFWGKVLAHTSMRKAFKKIVKLKLEKYQVGCLRPIWSLLSFVCTAEGRRNYSVAFCDRSTDKILLPNENEVTEFTFSAKNGVEMDFNCIEGSKTIISRLGIPLVRIIDRWGQADEKRT